MINRVRLRGSANLASRFAVPIALLALAVLSAALPAARWALLILIPMLAITAWDFIQSRHTLRRNYPLIARFRWGLEELRPYLRSYILEGDLEGRPFNHERALVYARAKGELGCPPLRNGTGCLFKRI